MFEKIYAQTLNLPGGTSVSGPPGLRSELFTLGGITGRAIPFIILFAGVGTLMMILAGGFQLLTGANDPKQLEMGKKRITWGLAGFFIIFLAYWVVQAVGIIFGIEEWKLIFPL
jgi:hypothetical protein